MFQEGSDAIDKGLGLLDLTMVSRLGNELEARARSLFKAISSGVVKIEVNQTFALKDAANAHRALAARETTGSTILLP